MLGRNRQAGDTIVEVLFASALFSMVAVTSLAIMSQGIASAQRSLELTQVRAQIDTQARALRFLADAYVRDYGKNGQATAVWQQIIAAHAVTTSQAQQFTDVVAGTSCVLPTNKPFALDIGRLDMPEQAVLTPQAEATTYARVMTDDDTPIAEGLWVQAVRSSEADGPTGYYDFHITACWQSPGQQRPVTLGTIVRLYEPRG